MPSDGFRLGTPRLVKKADRARDVNRDNTIIPASVLVDMALPGWDMRGMGGGGMCQVRNLFQRSRPAKGTKLTTKQAHPGFTKGVYPLRKVRTLMSKKEMREMLEQE